MNYEEELYKSLKSLPVCHDESLGYSGFVTVRCPFCGDSRKNPNNAHLYIKIIVDKDDRQWYKCQRCQEGGLVDDFLLDSLGIYDPILSELQKERNKNISKIVGKKGYRYNKIPTLKLLPPLDNIYTDAKIKYIENRLGIKLSIQDILNYKMVLNYWDFFKYNYIKQFTRHSNIIEGLDKNYIGFLTTKNEFINSRKIYDDYDDYFKRYINYNIFGLKDNTIRLYTITNKIDLMKNFKIIMAEGIFDIIGIHNHFYKKKKSDNLIFCAVLGSGYESAINYFIKRGILFADYYIYSDKEVKLSQYKKLKKKLDYKISDSKFIIFYNELGKDYGVTKDKIKLIKYEI